MLYITHIISDLERTLKITLSITWKFLVILLISDHVSFPWIFQVTGTPWLPQATQNSPWGQDWNFSKLFLMWSLGLCSWDFCFDFKTHTFYIYPYFYFLLSSLPLSFPFSILPSKKVPGIGHRMGLILIYMKFKYWRPIIMTRLSLLKS